jgi:homoaconitate hydratase
VTGKDVIITLCGFFNKDEVLNHAIEFAGDGIASLSIDARLSIANMTTEWGALAGIFPVDATTIAWYRARLAAIEARGLQGVPSDVDGNGAHPRITGQRIDAIETEMLRPDADAYYAKEVTLDLSHVLPHVSGPNTVKVMTSVLEMRSRDVRIDKAYLLSCVNSRVEDLAQAAAVVKGRKVAPHVQFYIAAASSEVQAESERRGDWKALLDAGAIALPPSCGPCIGLGTGLLEDGEVGISATNRNFKGRMGAPTSQAYLASPAVVAASAIAGKIEMPWNFHPLEVRGSIMAMPRAEKPQGEVTVIEGFPPVLEGEIIFCHQDNLNTDGIYPGKYTYNDDFTPQQQAQVVMENYDPTFVHMVNEGDFLAGGFNFGTGSSREQAATALKYRGIRLVIAGSFSETYKRNALNNGFLVIEAPELVIDLKQRFGTETPSVKTGVAATLDMKKACIVADGKTYSIDPVGPAAQELVLVGGLENWVVKNLG